MESKNFSNIQPEPLKWQYKTLIFGYPKSRDIDAGITEYAEKGWEFVGITSTSNAMGLVASCVAVMKRQGRGVPSKDNEAGEKLKRMMEERRK